MNESQEPYFEEEGIFESINRFEEMLNRKSSCYFDVYEFENIIDYYLDQHNVLNARAAIERGLRQHPYSSSLKFRLAQIYIQSGKPAKGLHFLREIESMESANSDFYLMKGSALNILGKKEDAHYAFDRAIALAVEAKDDVIYNIAYSYINIRRYNLAIKYLLLALEINPQNIAVIQELAMVYEKVEKPEKAIEYYLNFLDLDPYAENMWFNLGLIYSSLDQNDMAIEAYDFAIAIYPEYISAYFSKANTLVNMEQYREAIKTYEEIIFLEPENLQAFTYIGECYEKQEMNNQAIHFYKKVLELDDMYGDAWFGMGMAYFQMKDYYKGLEFFLKANSIDPENPEYWFMLGEVYKKLNLFDKSAEAFYRTVELDPNDFEAWISFADITYCEDKLNDAIDILNRAYQYNKDISTINYKLAAYYLISDQANLAYTFFEKGLSINYSEHNELLDRYPIASSNETITQLIRKYNNLRQ